MRACFAKRLVWGSLLADALTVVQAHPQALACIHVNIHIMYIWIAALLKGIRPCQAGPCSTTCVSADRTAGRPRQQNFGPLLLEIYQVDSSALLHTQP
jgi:hypothetical protein